MVNASTRREEEVMGAVETDCPADKRVVHIVKVSRCLEYINTKHVANIVS